MSYLLASLTYRTKWFFETSNILGVWESVKKVLITLRCADDAVMIATCEQKALDEVAKERAARGLILNVKKTEWMLLSKQKNDSICNSIRKEQQTT